MSAKVVAHRYELKEVLGAGGMGVVYRAIDTRTSSPVAIKTLRDASDPYTLELFRKEWAELAQLCHPNIVDVRDVDEIEEGGVRKPCFVMPLLPGCTLAALINSSSPRLTVERVVEIICQVCRGLQAAHEKDLIHRDLKPSNIFVMDDGTAKIIDFGLVHSATSKSITGMKGTWQYMAPEQIEGKPTTRRSDIFALGVVAYEALTGKQPFRKDRLEDTVDAVKHFIPPPISETNPKVTEILSKAVHVAMAKKPIHRYGSAREFADTLRKAYANQPIERFDPARIKPRIERARRAFSNSDCDFASDILAEIEAEGNVDPEISLLRAQIEESTKQKKIRQLFESAQTRIEQDEIPLAIDKLSEILKLDPGNAEALSMRRAVEERRSQQQISGWMELARQHFQRNDFQEARQALREVFNLRYDEPEALRLRSEIDVREKEAIRARGEKEQLYSSALKASERGEISSALSKLEKILELNKGVPGAAIPERDKVFQVFYNNMVSERDVIDNAYAEGSRHLNEKNFEKALRVCDQVLSRYARNAQFQALRLKIEQAQRQELSAYIVEVGKAVDNEANLDRRVGILEEACKRYPNEGQFLRQLSLAREHRDLVASILAKAKSYEEQEQFGEAIQQWKILANTHPLYPGTDFEISQLEKRRERQVEEERKVQLIARIDHALENFAFADAERLTKAALAEFPQNAELLALLRIALHGSERAEQAESLFEEAKTLRAAGKVDEAVEVLQRALKLDERNFGVRSALVNLLVERAHALLNDDWRAAEPLAQAAKELDPDHPSVKRLQSVIGETKRKDYVTQCLAQAREMQSADIRGALALVEKALAVYPAEPRLIQTRNSLRNLLTESVHLTRPEEEPANRARAAAAPAGPSIEDRTKLFHPAKDLPEGTFSKTGQFVNSELDRTIVTSGKQKARAPEPVRTAPVVQKSKPRAPTIDWAGLVHRASETLNKSRVKALHKAKIAFGASLQYGEHLKGLNLRSRRVQAAIAVIVAVIVAIIAITTRPGKRTATPSPSDKIEVTVRTTPADAELVVDGSRQAKKALRLTANKGYRVSVSRLGFKPIRSITQQPTRTWTFALEPEPLHISVYTAEPANSSGAVFLDGQNIGSLDRGQLTDFEFTPTPYGGKHNLAARNRVGELFNFTFQVTPGGRPVVEPLATRDLVVASSLGNGATVYSGDASKTLIVAGKAPQQIGSSGVAVNLEDAGTGLTIGSTRHRDTILAPQGNAPALTVSLNAIPNLGGITIKSKTKNATFFLDGQERSPYRPGFWALKTTPGPHTIKFVAPGMKDQELTIEVAKGSDVSKTIDLDPLPAVAALVIKNGTPGAKVFLDEDTYVGTLDEEGSLTYSGISPGTHNVRFQKDGYGPLTSRQPFREGQRLELPGDLRLVSLHGFVIVTVSPQETAVQYRKIGATEWQAVTLPSMPLAMGNYEFTATAPGFKRLQKDISIEGGKTTPLYLTLAPATVPKPPPPSSMFETLEDLTQDGLWFVGKTNGFVSLRPGISRCTLIFLRPDKYPSGRRKPKRLEWSVSSGAGSISYALDGHGLTRKTNIGGHETSEAKAINATDGYVYTVVLILEPDRVQVKGKDGAVLDEFINNDKNWTRARIAVRGNTYLVARQ